MRHAAHQRHHGLTRVGAGLEKGVYFSYPPMVAIVPRPARAVEDAEEFARFVTGLFAKRRKQLGGIFGRDRDWPAGVMAEMRPEALDVGQLVELRRVVTE